MGKLNLFRKGRGKDYRQTKRAIKKQIRKTGGYEATKDATTGKWNITGGSGATGKEQSGWSRRNLARDAAEALTPGIDKIAGKGGTDWDTSKGGVGVASGRTVTPIGGGKREINVDRGSYGATLKGGVDTRSYSDQTGGQDIKFKGPDAKKQATDFDAMNFSDQQNLIKSNTQKALNTVSSAFRMKYSPFNQGYGSPLNWNERSPLNNLNKGDDLVQSKDGAYMKESSALPCNDCGDSSPLNQSSPLNAGESGKPCKTKGGEDGKYNSKGNCVKVTKTQTVTDISDEDSNVRAREIEDQEKLEGTEGTEGKKNPAVDIYTRACGKKDDGKTRVDSETGRKIKCSRSPDPDYTPPEDTEGTEGDAPEETSTKTQEAEVPSKKACLEENGTWDAAKKKCVKGEDKTVKGAIGGEKSKSKIRGGCKGKKTWSEDLGKCVGPEKDPKDPKEKKCRKKWQRLVDGKCVGERPTDDDKAGIKDGVQGVDKKPGMKKVCTDWEWVEKGSGKGKKRSSAGPKPK